MAIEKCQPYFVGQLGLVERARQLQQDSRTTRSIVGAGHRLCAIGLGGIQVCHGRCVVVSSEKHQWAASGLADDCSQSNSTDVDGLFLHLPASSVQFVHKRNPRGAVRLRAQRSRSQSHQRGHTRQSSLPIEALDNRFRRRQRRGSSRRSAFD